VVTSRSVEERVRAICMALPDATEKPSHGAPAFFAGKQFVQLWPNGHHDHVFPHLWCAAAPGAQESLVVAGDGRFFRPPYVGGRGWVGVRLDGSVDWGEVEALCEEAYRTVAPARLVRRLEEREDPGRQANARCFGKAVGNHAAIPT
jgi:hypothetical protein